MTRTRGATWTGLALLAVHVLLFALLRDRCARSPLEVRVPIDVTGVAAPDRAVLPADLADRVALYVDGRERPHRSNRSGAAPPNRPGPPLGPGLHRFEWHVRYRGGFVRRAGITQLLGPFQNPTAPPCSVRLIVGQQFVDDGVAGPGTLAHAVAGFIEQRLADRDHWPLGRFVDLRAMHMRWMHLADLSSPTRVQRIRETVASRYAPPVTGFLQVSFELRFDRGLVPLWIAVVPVITAHGLAIQTYVDAELNLDSWLYQWLSALLNGDDVARTIAQDTIDKALAEGLRPLPTIALPGAGTLAFAYCPNRTVETATGQYAAIRLALEPNQPTFNPRLPRGVAAMATRPISLGSLGSLGAAASQPHLTLDAPLAVELEFDAINGILHQLWLSGTLDQALTRTNAVERFNRAPLVEQLLSVRMRDLRLSLPPVVWPGTGTNTQLGAEAALRIVDRGQVTPARLFGTVGIRFAGDAQHDTGLIAQLTPSELVLTCEPEPGIIAPCYTNLVQAWHDYTDTLHGALSQHVSDLFRDLLWQRHLGTDTTPVGFVIQHAHVRAVHTPPTGMIRINLHGALTVNAPP